MRKPQAFREGLGNQRRLVVSTLPFALPVEWHRYDYVGGELFSLAFRESRQLLCKPNTQRLDLLEFQQ